MNETHACRGITRLPVLFASLPTFLLLLLVAVSAATEIVLDHEILGRDANGMPVLASLPVVRAFVAAWNLAVIYLAPPALAILFLIAGAKRRVNLNAIMFGGALVCVVGGFLNLEAARTGIEGMSHLDVGPVSSIGTGVIRALVNLAIFGVAVFLLTPRHE